MILFISYNSIYNFLFFFYCQVHPVIQQVLNGTVHEEVINQQAPQQQQQPPPPPPAQQHPYIAEPTAQSQFVQEAELSNGEQQQQQSENEPQTQTEERNEQSETETFTVSAQETEPEHQVSSTTVNSSGPKTYANLVKSFPSTTTGATSPQAPKLSMSPVSFVLLVVSGFLMKKKKKINTFFFFAATYDESTFR